METELWKDIRGFEGIYQVSNLGRVKSLERSVFIGRNTRYIPEKILKPQKKLLKYTDPTNTYLQVKLRNRGKDRDANIHTLVWDAFGDGRKANNCLQVDHIDMNKSNNDIQNLRLLSARENTIRRVMSKRRSKYAGVNYRKKKNKWEAIININKKSKCLGTFNSEIEAALCYDKKRLQLQLIEGYSV